MFISLCLCSGSEMLSGFLNSTSDFFLIDFEVVIYITRIQITGVSNALIFPNLSDFSREFFSQNTETDHVNFYFCISNLGDIGGFGVYLH